VVKKEVKQEAFKLQKKKSAVGTGEIKKTSSKKKEAGDTLCLRTPSKREENRKVRRAPRTPETKLWSVASKREGRKK